MEKKNIAVLFGGCSSEYGVSLESAYGVLSAMDREKFRPVMVGISQVGRWYYYHGDLERIRDDRWCEPELCTPAVLSPDRGEGALLLRGPEGGSTIPLDAVFPVLHGRNGEDGTVQGLAALAGVPLVGCGVLASALCMDKDRAHKLAFLAGVRAPRAQVLSAPEELPRAAAFAEQVGYPLFVKPVKAGSSYGVTRVTEPGALDAAVRLAFSYDDTVILEENIPGFEVGCAVMGGRDLTVGEVDEIELSGGFFDFTEKYTLKTSAIHVPARVPPEKRREIQRAAMTVYRALGCTGFARVDLFLTPEGEIVFNEVNTIPGFTPHSRYPGMMAAAGIPFPDLLTRLIEGALET